MPINKNHEFEELNGIKCAIVEKNVSKDRTAFLKELLELNNFTVVIAPSPPPKAVPPPKPPDGETIAAVPPPPSPETFTVGVTNVAFNPTNAIFGRLLRTKDHRIVTLAYWEQKEPISDDETPYFEQTK